MQMLKEIKQTAVRLCLALMLTVPLVAATAPTAFASEGDNAKIYVLPGDSVFPEGVATDKSGKFYVSSAANGTIYVGSERTPTLSIFSAGGSDGRTSATGMKVDRQNRLFVSGAGLGKIFVYNTQNAALIKSFDVGQTPSFVNDVTIVKNGDAFFTDSLSPSIYRVYEQNGSLAFERWLDLPGSAITYVPGFNLNGIAATSDGKALIVIQSNTGKVFKIDVASKLASEININGAVLTGGDGILLQGHQLYVLRNAAQLLITLKLSDSLTDAQVVGVFTHPKFQFPTTFAKLDDKFLFANSQFDKQGGQPVLPFNVLGVSIPEHRSGKQLIAQLTGAAEVNGGDPDGSGSAQIKLKAKDGKVCFDLKVQGITLPAAASHIHAANAGTNGPVVVDFGTAPDANGRASGCVSAPTALINAIWTNPSGYYVNVHNIDFPGGAVRGQLAQADRDDRDD